ncbi:hypothetical protein KJ866_02300 [Patescibacteria group bacterium]|nr:hypothetical protein [Patescibacteria group bacterium]MBU2220251.1 hypothetical protein [Patescibacteria group bacterium]
MESWMIAFVVTIASWLAQAILSFKEGTFSLRQLQNRNVAVNFHGRYHWQHLPMSFLNNWTVSIGDLFIFPIINALVVPYLWLISGWQWKYFVCFIVGIAVSAIFHRAWWGHDENLGHVFIDWNWNIGMERTNLWVHFWFMAVQVAIVLLCIFTPMPDMMVVWWASVLLSVFVIIQNVQAVVIQKGGSPKFLFLTLVELFVIWAIVIIKIA